MHNDKTICLNMIVKNEAHIIASTLENLCHYIEFDYWVIVDTGSTDNTKQIIYDFFKNKNIKGELHETEWKNFGFNRSDALSKAFNKTDYLLIFDADDRIVGDFILPKELNLDGYHIKFGDNFSYVRLLLVNNKLRWKFVGVLHEYIACMNENYGCKFENIEGNYHLISGKSGARSNNPNKYRDDALLLETAYDEAAKINDDLMVRYSFYCAQSYKDAGNVAKSIEWYKKRITHGGWNQEVYYSYVTIGELYAKINNIESAFYYWTLSFNADPERCEGIYYIIKHCREKGQFQLAFHYYNWIEKNKTRNLLDKLFVTEDIYKYFLDYEFTIIACYVNQHNRVIPSFHTLFKYADALRIGLKENIVYNLQFYLNFIDCSIENLPFFYDYLAFVKQIYLETGGLKKHSVDITDTMKDKFTPILTHYDYSKIISLTNSCKELTDAESDSANELYVTTCHDVILTMTSCKRFDLFQKTVNSFINNCSDVNKITYFFCVDDNSSDKDREQMVKMYPFFDFYFKTVDEKGHRQSMNIIWNKLNELKPKFYLHLEDDWLFINKCNYITNSVSFLNRYESDEIHQILFNKNYAEVIHHYNTVGGKIMENTNSMFKLHIKDESNLSGSNCAYWPHFSFRPSMIRTSAVLTLGNFDSPNAFFERDYADKYFNSGYMSAYFNEVNNIHIGKLTSESQSVKKNAYELNDEEQFFNSGNTHTHALSNLNKIKVINLLRRPDRKDNVIQNFKNVNITDYEFVEAVDGNAVTPTSEIITLFKGNDFGNRRGVIGCALTHYNLWKKLLESEFDYFLIMEDDFSIVHSFKAEIENINFEKYDILLMGYHMFSKTLEKVKEIYYRNYNENCENEDMSLIVDKLQMDYYIGGTHCYSINKNGARKLLDYINKNGIKHGIDYLFKIVPELECFETRPHISFAEWNEGGKAIDSDIQNMYDSIDLSDTLDGLLQKYDYYPNQDFFGSDIHYIGNKSLLDQLLIAEKNTNCVCFNTLGYFKHEFDATKLIKINCGLYVKKKYISSFKNIISQPSNKMRVKMMCDWCSSEQLCQEWSNMCLDGFRWKNIEITWDNENIDYYVIINRTNETCYDKSRTIVFQMEPWVYDDEKNWGVKTWGEWSKPDSSLFFHIHSHVNYLNNVQWLLKQPLSVVSKDFTEKNINKFDKILTCVCSEKNNDVGHQLRNNFIHYMEKNRDAHSIVLQVFGKSNFYNFTSYIGKLLDDDKYHSLIQYKYHISCENNSEHNYASEKIWEPILCECLCFYHGCPNLEDYIDSNAFVRIDLNDFESSLQIVKRAIEEDWWSQRLPFIRAEKQKILTKLGFFPTLKNIIESK